MKLDIKTILSKVQPILGLFKNYIKFIFVILVLCLIGFMIFRINSFAQSEPSATEIQDRLKTTQRPKIDQDTLNKIQDLQDQNVQVHSLFDDARNNPFNE